ncbi:hypothetical protein FE257_009835 [Aspergillus nanangensis]|uniref:Major facilitator superfamily (MFS) profile domain-containing protein n=1 Tax=Aspergillus nanangensis TaxID=2582783 RepID=A0AAD4GY65_ASPNN|nr:hypothetical protein FE257_009835 [Aspergillus nanangensis]
MTMTTQNTSTPTKDIASGPIQSIRESNSEEALASDTNEESIRATERGLVRKLDWTLMPILWILYMLKNLDKFNISQAKLSSLEDDLGMHGTQYNTVVSMATVGYIPMMIPSNMMITRVRPSLFLSIFAILWSIIATAMAASQSYSQIAGLRFLLGLFEAPFAPGALWLMSCWYTKRELGLRVAIMHSGAIMASSFAGLIAAGVFSKLEGYKGMGGWRWLFIIEGSISLGFALLAIGLLFDSPGDSPEKMSGAGRWILSEKEKECAIERIRQDQVSNQITSNRSVWFGLKLAIRDYRVWMLALIALPPSMFSAVVQLIVAWLSDRFCDRSGPIILSMIVMIIGLAVDMGTDTSRSAVRYFASFLYITGSDAVFSIPRAWVATAASQTSEERACAAAILEVISALSYIWSPYFFRNEDAPRYRPGMIILIVFAVACGAVTGLMRWLLWRDNRKILAKYQGTGLTPVLHPI